MKFSFRDGSEYYRARAGLGMASLAARGRALAMSIVALVACACLAPLGEVHADAPHGAFEEFPVVVDSTFGELREIAGDSEGGIWFVAGEGTSTTVIGRMSTSGRITGEFVVPTGTQPNVPERYSAPEDLALGPDGNIWFADHGTDAEGRALIGRITPAGRIDEFPLPAAVPIQNGYPGGIAPGPDDHMWFTEPSAHSIGRISLDGKVIELFPIPSEPLSPGPERDASPMDIALGPDGNMWFTDTGGYIGRITPAGKASEFPTQYIGVPWSIALGADGNMWFTALGRSEDIGRVTPSGEISEFPIPKGTAGRFRPPGSNAMNGIVLGPDGNMWFSDTGGSAIGRVAPSGAITMFGPISISPSAPSSVALGADGNIWFADQVGVFDGGQIIVHLGRFITPFAPANAEPPMLSGRPIQGEALSVSSGSWSHDPDTLAYQWQSCDATGSGCTDLSGEVGASHILMGSEVGHRLRAVITASNIGGLASAVSALSAVVQPPPPSPQPSPAPNRHQALTGATMTWRFKPSRRYTTIEALAVHRPPVGGSVEITCRGRGCAFARKRFAIFPGDQRCGAAKCAGRRRLRAPRDLTLTGIFRHRRLGVGTRILVSVAKAGLIGKVFSFTIRSSRPPTAIVSCLRVVSSSVGGSC